MVGIQTFEYIAEILACLQVKEGIECGMQVLNLTDWREGDVITCYEEVVKYRTLEESSEAKQLTSVQLGQTVPAAA